MSSNTASYLKRASQLVGVGLFLAALVYVGIALRQTWTSFTDLTQAVSGVGPGVVGGALLAYWLSVLVQSHAWSFGASRLAGDGPQISHRRLLIAYVAAHVYRYLPGNIGHYLARQYLLRKSSVSQGSLALASINEIASQVFAALLCSAMLVPMLADTDLEALYRHQLLSNATISDAVLVAGLVGLVVLALVLAFAPVLRQQLMSRLAVIWMRLTTDPSIFVRSVLANVVFLMVNGLLFATLLFWYYGLAIELATMVAMVGMFSLCWLIGFVVPGAPAGLGIRDALLIYLCGTLFLMEGAALLVVAFRFFQIVGDLILSLIASALSRTALNSQASIE